MRRLVFPARLAVLSGLLVGCSFDRSLPQSESFDAAPSPNGGAGGTGGAGDPGALNGARPAQRDGGPVAEVEASSGGVVVDTSCAAKATPKDCLACCTMRSPGGNRVLNKAFDDCICTTPGTCSIECGDTYCADLLACATFGSACLVIHEASEACQTCIDTEVTGACGKAASDACQADLTCRTLAACERTCGS